MNMGAIIWLMLHTFAEKIKPDVYISKKEEIIDFIKKLYYKLHCKICSSDSLNYLYNYSNSLNTQTDFKMYLYNFHLHVNKKLHKKFFSVEQLKIYENTKTKNIFNLYISTIKPEQEIRDFLTLNIDWFN